MRHHLAALTKLDPTWEYTQTGYRVAGHRLERWPGNQWTVTGAARTFGSLTEALDWVAWKKKKGN